MAWPWTAWLLVGVYGFLAALALMSIAGCVLLYAHLVSSYGSYVRVSLQKLYHEIRYRANGDARQHQGPGDND